MANDKGKKPGVRDRQRQAYALRSRGLTFEEISLIYKFKDRDGNDRRVFSSRQAAKVAYDREVANLIHEDIDYRRKNVSLIDTMISDLLSSTGWKAFKEPKIANAVRGLIIVQSALTGSIKNTSVGATADQSGQLSLPGQGSVSTLYANWGGTEDLDGAAEIIEAEYEDIEDEGEE